MGFMNKVGATIATKYGTVTEGRHEGTVVALGNDPSKKVETSNSFEQIIFLEGTEEKGRYDISSSFTSLDIIGTTPDGIRVKADYVDGDSFTMLLEWKKEDGMAKGAIKMLLGAKKVDATPEEEAERRCRPIKVFTEMFEAKLTAQLAEYLLELYKENNILDENLEKKLKKVVERA